jgi:BNR repeat-like domain
MDRTTARVGVLAFVLAAAFCVAATASGATGRIQVSPVVDVSRDQLSQNETPLAVNPANPQNLLTGANDWNYNDGCAMNASFDGGRSWTPTLPNGFLPGVTKFTNDPNVPGTGVYDAGGDPVIGFGPDGTAYFVCQAFDLGGGGGNSGHQIALLANRSTDGGRTWLTKGLTQITTWQGNGVTKGSNGQFADHESMHVDNSATSKYNGAIYVTWAQFSGNVNSDVYVSVSRDGARTFSRPVLVTSSNVKNNQDQRIVTAPDGTAYLTFDNSVNGKKNLVLFVSKSTDGGQTWSAPTQFGSVNNAVCLFPPDCFNISGNPFRAGGTYPAPTYDPLRNRLDVIYADIVDGKAQIFFTWANASDLTRWSMPTVVAAGGGDRFQAELSSAPNGRIDVSFYDRSYSNNTQVDMTYATSSDGGQSWRSARVSSASFDPYDWGVPSSSALGRRPFIGDYNGIVSTATTAGLTWTGVAPPAPYNLEIDYATVTP